jgi:hypothetical protein
MAATKQFLLNYDSNILLPYTTLDCILGKEDDDPDAAKTTGIDVITDNLLKNMKEFIYNTGENVLENQIKGSDISKAYVLGISTLRDGGAQVYTKFHELTLDASAQAGQYLGADGTTHDIKFAANKHNTWYSTSIDVKPSIRLDNPISADVSININISNDCFEIVEGHLYSKYSTKATDANVSKFAHHANKIATVTDTSTGATDVITIGSNIAIQLNNGDLTAIKNIGGAKRPIYIEENGAITQFSESEGTAKRPVYLSSGVLTACNDAIGNSRGPIFYDPCVGFTQCSGNYGSNTKFAYINGGEFAQSDVSLGGDDNKPIFLKDGVFTEFTHSVPTYTGTGVGTSNKPTFVNESGEVKECTYSAATANSNKLIYASQGVISEQAGSAGGTSQPVYLNAGQIVPITTSIGNGTKPVYLDNGVIKAFSTNVGGKNKPVYIADGTFTAITENIGNSLNPVYLEGGVISQCTLKPESISGADTPELYLMSDTNGKGVWGKGNTTTAGTFDNDTTATYYLVGINSSDASTDGTFKRLTGAKRSEGSGIYFKNYELFQTSDEKLKTFTDDIDINFDNLATIKKGIYHWTDDPNKISDVGIGARSLEALYPEIVDENDGIKTVAYNRLGVIALAAIDKLHLRVKELETEMKELKAEIRALKQGK